jgi:para-nitrobenzyl esterase
MKKLMFFFMLPGIIAATSERYSDSNKKIDVKKVRTESGYISGKTSVEGAVKIFMGVPFAAPPVDELRWKAPQPVKGWKGVRECVTPPSSAMQAKPVPFMMWSKEFMAPQEPLSEDCLYLNIWTGAERSGDKRPVIVWIHGGAFTGGSGTVPLYDGEEMAKKGVVFITINYRLGVFGFLAHPELSAESDMKVSGNYGILDQIEALKWISKNITSFGGDPANITIAGQSAGSFSLNAIVVSPLAKGLFHKAIAQSGGFFGKGIGLINNLKSAEEDGLKFAEKLKSKSINDLRAKTAIELMSAGGRWGLVVDDIVIQNPERAFSEGKQNDVPLITGWNADDGFLMGVQKANEFRANAVKNYGNMSEEFLKLFPAGNDEEAGASQKLASQLSFGWQNYHWAVVQNQKGNSKAYLYNFTRVPPGEPGYGAFHSAEFGYALHTLNKWDRPFTDWDHKLSDIMSSYWVNFARSGNPNGKGLPLWPAFDSSSSMVIILGDKVEAEVLPNRKQLEFLDSINK